MRDLEALESITALGLTTDDIENLVDQLSTLGVMTLGPVVAGARLSKHKVVGSEELSVGAGADRVHRAWFQVDENGSGNILVAGCLWEARSETEKRIGLDCVTPCRVCVYLVEIDIDTVQLDVVVTVVPDGSVRRRRDGRFREVCLHAVGVEAVLARNRLPEGRTDLVTL